MSDKFEVQNIIDHGVGDFHLNHHIGFFDGKDLPHVDFSANMCFPLDDIWAARIGKTASTEKDIDADDVTSHLMEVLEHIFNPNSTASCERGALLHQGQPTLRFRGKVLSLETPFGGLTASVPHDDWVYLKEHATHPHLCGTTLNRVEWNMEDLAVETLNHVTPLLSPFIAPITGPIIPIIASESVDSVVPDDNSRHFLAGRRVWRCGYSEEHELHFFETAAFERFSDHAYANLEDMIRPMLDTCWVETVLNFSFLLGTPLKSIGSMSGYSKHRVVPPSSAPSAFPAGVPAYGPVYTRNESFSAEDVDAVIEAYEDQSWFQTIARNMPFLSIDEMPGF